jgi:hypothetical protein
MSTGAWIFTGLVCAAVIVPASVYAAAVAKTQLVGSTQTHVAGVTAQGQLLTTPISPSRVVRAVTTTANANTLCQNVYTPPPGKAIVVTAAVYNFGSGTQGNENFGGLFSASCNDIVDQIDGTEKYDTIEHTFPTGLPLNGVAVNSTGGKITVFICGYLIDASSLPSAAMSHLSHIVKAMPRPAR